jgi:hypothetical protein
VIFVAIRGRRKRRNLILVLCLVAVPVVTVLLDLAVDALGDREVLPWRLNMIRDHLEWWVPALLAALIVLAVLGWWAGHARESALDLPTDSGEEAGRVPPSPPEITVVKATAEMRRFPIHTTPDVEVHVELYAVPPTGSETIIPNHLVSMEIRLDAERETKACSTRVRASQSAPGQTQRHAVRQDNQQVVIERPGYFTVTGHRSVPAELEQAPPESIGVLFSLRPAGSTQSRTYELLLTLTQPAIEAARRHEFRAQWEWKATDGRL